MLKKFIRSIYYFFYQIFFSRFFILNFPNKIVLFDKKKFFFFSQYIRNKHDLNTVRQIFVKEEYSFEKLLNNRINNYYNEILNKNKIPLIIDCGSNIGSSSNYFQIIFPKSKVVAIEADTENIKLFKKNSLSNKISLFENALSSQVFNYELIRSLDSDWRSSTIKKIYNEKIDSNKLVSITIPEILKKFNIVDYEPFLIKIDIEGHEKELFESNIEWVKEFNIFIIELHDWILPNQNISENFYRAFSSLDKEIFTYGENTVVINKSK